MSVKPWERPGEGHNLIINTQETEREFQSRLSLGERRVEKKPNQILEGTSESKRADDLQAPVGNIGAWMIDLWLCMDCEQRKQPFRQGVQMFVEAMPEIDMTPLDVVFFSLCKECFIDEQTGRDLVILDADGDETDTRQERRERRIIEWLKAAKLRGEAITRFDGTGRKIQ